MRHKDIFIIESLGQHMHRITKITQLNMVMRGDFKASILIKLKYYIYDLISILKRIFFLEGEGLKKDEVFLVL